jgi:hypothetical protein
LGAFQKLHLTLSSQGNRERQSSLAQFELMNMKTRQCRRQTAKVSHSRWVAYATAGAATALTVSHSAEAAIHYQVVDKKFPRHSEGGKWFQLDQPGDSIYFFHQYSPGPDAASFNVTGIGEAAFRGVPGTSKYYYIGRNVSKLSFGESIAAGHFTQAIPSFFGSVYGGFLARSTYGYWRSPGMGFIGFKFNNGAGTQYGWARVRISTWFPGNYAFVVLDFAYADPGERITAGEGIPRGKEDDQNISDDHGPDEGCLGGLALGAVGLLAWRKSRSRTARSEAA